jgi:hypothetical protein
VCVSYNNEDGPVNIHKLVANQAVSWCMQKTTDPVTVGSLGFGRNPAST